MVRERGGVVSATDRCAPGMAVRVRRVAVTMSSRCRIIVKCLGNARALWFEGIMTR
jgi:hypothetical protein